MSVKEEKEETIGLVEEEDTIGNPRRRKRKPPSRASKEKKDRSLDDEGLSAEITRICSETIETFFCFR